MLKYVPDAWTDVLTIKFPEIILNTLQQCASTLGLCDEATGKSLSLVAPDDIHDRKHDSRCNNSKTSVSPSPAAGFDERLGCTGTDKRSENIWRTRNCGYKSSVLEARGVGHENLENICYAVRSDPVEDLNQIISD
jgi:hypothetical protein